MSVFKSFFQAGFECSTHRRRHDSRRLDLTAATYHDIHALADYQTLADLDIRTVRDGLRWHLIETSPGKYDFSGVRPMFAAAHDTDMQVIWDLWHYGWPDDIDLFPTSSSSALSPSAEPRSRSLANTPTCHLFLPSTKSRSSHGRRAMPASSTPSPRTVAAT